jgi:ABC-type spermidine/putrescine transport system permease subunit II
MASNRLLNALIGAVVTVVTSVVPLSPVLGGAVAGYLQRGDNEEGATVGALSGVLVTVPLAVIGTLLVALFTIAPQGGGLGLVAGVFLLSVFVVGLYAVSLSVLGGVIGAYLAREYRRETDDEFDSSENEAIEAVSTARTE